MNLNVSFSLLIVLLMNSLVHSELSGRIVGGFPIAIEAVPYQVSLQQVIFGAFTRHFCGGSIISPVYIVTASHCVDGLNARDIIILAGTAFHDRSGVKRKVKRIIMHEQYKKAEQDFDIALIELSSPLEYGQTIQPIALPKSNQSIADDTRCLVSGWGSTYSFLVFLFRRTELRAVEVPIISQNLCEKNYEKADVEITPREFCAGFEDGGKDSCQGDSGGPLACPLNGTTVLTGIVSWGNDCAEPYFPGVYSRVQAFSDWIYENTGI